MLQSTKINIWFGVGIPGPPTHHTSQLRLLKKICFTLLNFAFKSAPHGPISRLSFPNPTPESRAGKCKSVLRCLHQMGCLHGWALNSSEAS